MGKEDQEGKGGSGCIGKLFGLIVFFTIAGLGVGMLFVSQPQDLSDLGKDGPVPATPASPPRDMEAVLTKSIEGDYSVTLSEKELNEWLGRELKLKQAGQLAKWVSMKRVWVRLREDVAEVIVEREVAGRPFTTSMFVKIEQTESNSGISTQVHLHGGGYNEMVPRPTRGGRFGQLVVPQGFLIILVPEYERLAKLFETEIDLGFQRMARIKIENKRLLLDPKQPTRAAEGGDTNF